MSEHQGHEHDNDPSNDGHGHIPSPVRSAMGLLADSLDKARNLAGPAGEKARHVTDKVREDLGKVREDLGKVREDFDKVRDESAGVFDKMRDEGSNVVNKLRGHSDKSGPYVATGSAAGPTSSGSRDEMRDKAMEALDIAKTVGAALLVGAVKAVQLAMREWHAHTGNASTPEDNMPTSATTAAWDTAGTPKAPAYAEPNEDSEAPVEPEVNNWDDVEAEVAGGDAWGEETDPAERDSVETVSPAPGHVEVEEVLAYTSESDSPLGDADGGGVALRAAAAPEHSGHAHGSHTGGPNEHSSAEHLHREAPLEGFDEMTIGSLRGRLGSLSLPALEALRDYERTHTGRPQVLTMLENRIAKVTAQGNDA